MSHPAWFQIKNATAVAAEIFIYDYIGNAGSTDAATFVKQLQEVTAKKINLRINSPGGSVFEGIAIYNAIARHGAEVTTYIDGLAASIASVVALAGRKVLIADNAMMMIHDPSVMAGGAAGDMRKLADLLDQIKETMLNIYVGRTGLDRARVATMMAAETWMTAKEAVENKFADQSFPALRAAASFDLAALGYTKVPGSFCAHVRTAPAARPDISHLPGLARCEASILWKLSQNPSASKVDRARAAEDFKQLVARYESLKSECARIAPASVSPLDRVASLKDSIATAEHMMAAGGLKEKEIELFRATLAERRVMLLAEETKAHEEQQKIFEKHIESADKLAKLRFDALPLEEQITALEKKRVEIVSAIAEKKKKGEDTTEADINLLETTNELEKKRGEIVADNTKKSADAEAAKRDFMQRQAEIQDILAKGVGALSDEDKARLKTLAGENSVLKDQIKIVEDLTQQFTNFTVAITRVGNSYESQSTIALQGSLARLKSQLQPLPEGYQPLITASGAGLHYAAYLNNAALNPEIQAIEAELRRRSEVGQYAALYGEEETRYRYGDTATDKALRDMSDDNKRTRTATEQISTDLRRIFELR